MAEYSPPTNIIFTLQHLLYVFSYDKLQLEHAIAIIWWTSTAAVAPIQAYVLADTALAGYRRQQQGASREQVAAACVHTATFQTVASLALPAVAWKNVGKHGWIRQEKSNMWGRWILEWYHGDSSFKIVLKSFSHDKTTI